MCSNRDTASCGDPRAALVHMQEKKLKRAQGIEGPPWTQKDETHFIKEHLNVSSQGVCFVTVK